MCSVCHYPRLPAFINVWGGLGLVETTPGRFSNEIENNLFNEVQGASNRTYF